MEISDKMCEQSSNKLITHWSAEKNGLCKTAAGNSISKKRIKFEKLMWNAIKQITHTYAILGWCIESIHWSSSWVCFPIGFIDRFAKFPNRMNIKESMNSNDAL